ncbi:hypothetical protein IJV79_02635, partial [bacterium]|nr:hypothetical protein [bacterium]
MNFSKNKNFAMFITAIIGLGISILLFHLYMQSNYNPTALASFCSINEVVDCDGVERSMLAQVFGIPFACWGMIIYSVMIILLFADKLKNIKFLGFFEVFKNPTKYVSAIGYIAFTLSLVLAITAYVQIKKICIVCALTYVCDITIALLGTNFKNGGIADVFKTSIDDFISAVK